MNKRRAIHPVRDTDIVYNESCMPVRDENGIVEMPLLFPPKEILCVTSADEKTVYEQGTDWELVNGKLRLTDSCAAYAFTEAELYPTEKPTDIGSFPMNDRYLLFGEGDFFIKRQLAVTYTTDGAWDGARPALADKKLPRSFAKLRNRDLLNLVFFGDSITYGADSSASLNIPPHRPGYARQLHEALCDHYSEYITYINTAVGGKETNWAVDTVEERVNAYSPDLVVLAFGMNDGDKSPAAFEANIREVIRRVRDKHPLCEFILVATSLPNPLLTDPRAQFWGNQAHFKDALDAIAADTDGTVVANIRDMQSVLLDHKRFIDLTSNQVNHPNDFFYRCYAQFLAGMLID